MGTKMAVAFANIFMARIEKAVPSHRYLPTPNISFGLLPTSLPRFLPPPYFSRPFLPPSFSAHAPLGADVNLQRTEGGLWKSTNSDESGYVNFRLL